MPQLIRDVRHYCSRWRCDLLLLSFETEPYPSAKLTETGEKARASTLAWLRRHRIPCIPCHPPTDEGFIEQAWDGSVAVSLRGKDCARRRQLFGRRFGNRTSTPANSGVQARLVAFARFGDWHPGPAL